MQIPLYTETEDFLQYLLSAPLCWPGEATQSGRATPINMGDVRANVDSVVYDTDRYIQGCPAAVTQVAAIVTDFVSLATYSRLL